MINFYSSQFSLVWSRLEESVARLYNTGPGQKFKVSGKDAILLLFKTVKYVGHWDVLARDFKTKGPNFERLVSIFSTLISVFAYYCLVGEVRKLFLMGDLILNEKLFFGLPETRYVVDVSFQEIFRSSGSIEERMSFFNG